MLIKMLHFQAPGAIPKLPKTFQLRFAQVSAHTEPPRPHSPPKIVPRCNILNSHFLPLSPFSYFPRLPLYEFPISETYLDLFATSYYIEIYSGELLWINESQVIAFSVGHPIQI